MFTLYDVAQHESDKGEKPPAGKLVSFRVNPDFLKEFEETIKLRYRFVPTFTQMMVDAMRHLMESGPKPRGKSPQKSRKKKP